jgi:hypothetical protein
MPQRVKLGERRMTPFQDRELRLGDPVAGLLREVGRVILNRPVDPGLARHPAFQGLDGARCVRCVMQEPHMIDARLPFDEGEQRAVVRISDQADVPGADPQSNPSLANTSFGSRPASNWSRSSFSIAM